MNWQNFKDHPVTTVLGLLGGVLAYLAAQPMLDQHPAAPQWLGVVGGALVAVLGGLSGGKPKA